MEEHEALLASSECEEGQRAQLRALIIVSLMLAGTIVVVDAGGNEKQNCVTTVSHRRCKISKEFVV